MGALLIIIKDTFGPLSGSLRAPAMNSQEFERLLRGAFVPRVLVVTTDEVESAALKNGGKLADLLRPYCDFPDEAKPLRGIREEPYELKGFRCQLVDISELQLGEGQLEETAEKELSALVKRAQPSDLTVRYHKAFSASTMEEAIRFPRNRPIAAVLPWYEDYQRHFLSSFGVTEHEFFSHPVACGLSLLWRAILTMGLQVCL